MKVIILFSLMYIGLTACQNTNIPFNKQQQIQLAKQYQASLQEFYKDSTTTPLYPDEKTDFKGITFFPINENMIVVADFKPIINGVNIAFPTSSGKIKHFLEYGTLSFELNDKACLLTVYQSNPPIKGYEDELFLPFRDKTNNITTYGNGRYIDLKQSDIKQEQVIINFNMAYNPYCAYSKHYNCPITPFNNNLDLSVEAGVRMSK